MSSSRQRELDALDSLFRAGFLTPDEFAARKKQILSTDAEGAGVFLFVCLFWVESGSLGYWFR